MLQTQKNLQRAISFMVKHEIIKLQTVPNESLSVIINANYKINKCYTSKNSGHRKQFTLTILSTI